MCLAKLRGDQHGRSTVNQEAGMSPVTFETVCHEVATGTCLRTDTSVPLRSSRDTPVSMITQNHLN